jgi:nicotinate-nucleotide adenylyltransferase
VGGGAPITPVELPKHVRTLVVFGGSFDPPHFYHTVGPLSVVARVFGETGWVLYVPAAASPLKQGGPHASDAHRLAMLRLALDIPGWRSIWTDELDRAAWARARGMRSTPSYTIDTLRRLRAVVPARVGLRLLIGSDQAAAFHRWKDARAIIELAEPVVMVREPIVTACALWSALGDNWTREEKVAWCRRIAPNFPLEAASTTLRESIPGAPRRADAWDRRRNLRGLVTPVAQYIIDHNLYGYRPGPEKPAG